MPQLCVVLVALVATATGIVLRILRDRRAKNREIAKVEFLAVLEESEIETIKEALLKIGVLDQWSEDCGGGYRFCGVKAFDLFPPMVFAGIIGSLLHNTIITPSEVACSFLNLNPGTDEIEDFTRAVSHRHPTTVGGPLDIEFDQQIKCRRSIEEACRKNRAISKGVALLKK